MRRNGAAHVIGDHNRLHAQLLDGVLRLCDGLLWRHHGHHGHRGHAPGKGPEHVGVRAVNGAADGLTQLIHRHGHLYQAQSGIDQGKIDPEVIEPFIHQAGHHGSGAVQGIGRLPPPGRSPQARRQPFRRTERIPEAFLRFGGVEPVHHGRAADLAQVVKKYRHGLQPMTIPVNDGMVQAGTHGGGLGIA
jgi:hypothetical protein